MTDETPSERLSARVMDKLVARGLLRESSRKAFGSKVASGKVKGLDWKLELELAGAAERAR